MSAEAAKGRVDLDATRTNLEQLGMNHAAEKLSELVNEAVKQNLAAHKFLDKLLTAELSEREERRIKTSLRLSGLPPGQTLGNFDFSFQPSVEKSRIETLGTCEWIREHETVLIQGPPGVGMRGRGGRNDGAPAAVVRGSRYNDNLTPGPTPRTRRRATLDQNSAAA